MTDKEIEDFKQYAQSLDASFDEYQMLISIMVRNAAKEHLDGFLEHLKQQ